MPRVFGRVRVAQASDAPAIVALLGAAGLLVQAEGLTYDDFQSTLVSEHGGEIIGIVRFFTSKPYGMVDLLAVRPDYQSRGVAFGLISCAEAMMAAQGVHTYQGFVPHGKDGYRDMVRRMGGVALDEGTMFMKRISHGR